MTISEKQKMKFESTISFSVKDSKKKWKKISKDQDSIKYFEEDFSLNVLHFVEKPVNERTKLLLDVLKSRSDYQPKKIPVPRVSSSTLRDAKRKYSTTIRFKTCIDLKLTKILTKKLFKLKK